MLFKSFKMRLKILLSIIKALIKRNQDLTPTSNEQTQLLNLLSKIQTILDNLILAPGDFDACVNICYNHCFFCYLDALFEYLPFMNNKQLDEIKQVGSFKKGTMLMSNKLVADMCVVLKTLPTSK
jgi:interleukin enhancer-binding factor 2